MKVRRRVLSLLAIGGKLVHCELEEDTVGPSGAVKKLSVFEASPTGAVMGKVIVVVVVVAVVVVVVVVVAVEVAVVVAVVVVEVVVIAIIGSSSNATAKILEIKLN